MFVFRCVFFSVACLQMLDPVVSPKANVKAGQDVTLNCQDRSNVTITLLKWRKQLTGYVFFYRDNHSFENFQHESFHGRVELNDPQMKDGDVSIIIKNVTINDTGRYECFTGNSSITQAVQLKYILNLTVTDWTGDGGNNGGNLGLLIGLSVAFGVLLLLLLLVVCVCFIFYKKVTKVKNPGDEEANSKSEVSQISLLMPQQIDEQEN